MIYIPEFALIKGFDSKVFGLISHDASIDRAFLCSGPRSEFLGSKRLVTTVLEVLFMELWTPNTSFSVVHNNNKKKKKKKKIKEKKEYSRKQRSAGSNLFRPKPGTNLISFMKCGQISREKEFAR